MIPIGVMMRRAREMRRMTQRQVALAMGTTQSSVSEWEVGSTVPAASTLRRWGETVGFVMHVSFTPVEFVDEPAYPWAPEASYRGPAFGHGDVEEEL